MALKVLDGRVGSYPCLLVKQLRDADEIGQVRVFEEDVNLLIKELQAFRRKVIRTRPRVPKVVAKQEILPLT